MEYGWSVINHEVLPKNMGVFNAITFPLAVLFLLVLFICFTRRYDSLLQYKTAARTVRFKKYFKAFLKDTCTSQKIVYMEDGDPIFVLNSRNFSGDIENNFSLNI